MTKLELLCALQSCVVFRPQVKYSSLPSSSSLTGAWMSSWLQGLHISYKQRMKTPAGCGVPLRWGGGVDITGIWLCSCVGVGECAWEKSRGPVLPRDVVAFSLLFLFQYCDLSSLSRHCSYSWCWPEGLFSQLLQRHQTGPRVEVAGPGRHTSALETTFGLGLFLAGGGSHIPPVSPWSWDIMVFHKETDLNPVSFLCMCVWFLKYFIEV